MSSKTERAYFTETWDGLAPLRLWLIQGYSFPYRSLDRLREQRLPWDSKWQWPWHAAFSAEIERGRS